MATLRVFAGTADGAIMSHDPTYLTARSGGGTFVLNSGGSSVEAVGQEKLSDSYCYEQFFGFDTSSLGAGAIVTSAILTFYHPSRAIAGANPVIQARLYNWGDTVTTADWVPGANLSALPLLAHITAGSATLAAYNNWTDDAFAANVNKTGTTRIVVSSDRLAAATAPTSTEYLSTNMADQAGTTTDPYLTVTYTPAVRSSGRARGRRG